MFQRCCQISLCLVLTGLLLLGCQKLEDEKRDRFVIPQLDPVDFPDTGYETSAPAGDSPPAVSLVPQAGMVSESLKDGNTIGVISGGSLTANGLQLQGGGGYIQYRIPTTTHGFAEFSASGFVSNELHGGEEFKAVIFTMWSGDDGYFYESAPFIFEVRKFGHIPGRADATDSMSVRVKSHGTWDVGHYTVLSWDRGRSYRFRVEWGGGRVTVWRDGQVAATGTYRAEFQPSNHHVQIGAQPLRRKESPHNLLIADVVIGSK